MTALGKGVKLEKSLEILWWNSGTWGSLGPVHTEGMGLVDLEYPSQFCLHFVKKEVLGIFTAAGKCWVPAAMEQEALGALSRSPLRGQHPQNKKRRAQEEKGEDS